MIYRTEVFLDNNATTQPLADVAAAVADCLNGSFGNASSPHSRGRQCRYLIEQARDQAAQALDTAADTLIFTSCGTEANNMVLRTLTSRNLTPRRLLTTPVEHASVLNTAAFLERNGSEVDYLPIDHDGLIVLEQFIDLLDRFQPDLVSVQWANSETGVLQPIKDIATLCREREIAVHTDAAQAVGRVPVSVQQVPVDYLTFTGHKLHAPLGTGVLYCRQPDALTPLLYGGDQEQGRRPGTENLPAIVGLGKALSIRLAHFDEAVAHMRQLRDRFETELLDRLDYVSINGHRAQRVCNTSNLRFAGIDGQALIAQLDRQSIYASQTSACSSQRPQPSHVLSAMGLTEDAAFQSIRFSFSVLNTEEDVQRAIEAIVESCQQLAKFSLF